MSSFGLVVGQVVVAILAQVGNLSRRQQLFPQMSAPGRDCAAHGTLAAAAHTVEPPLRKVVVIGGSRLCGQMFLAST